MLYNVNELLDKKLVLDKLYLESNLSSTKDKINFLKEKLNIWKDSNEFFNSTDLESSLSELEKLYLTNRY